MSYILQHNPSLTNEIVLSKSVFFYQTISIFIYKLSVKQL